MLGSILYRFEDELISNNVVYLSNVAAALPGSTILKENGIKSVFSILQPAGLGATYQTMTDLYGLETKGKLILRDGLDTIVEDTDSHILYYCLNIADVSNPAILASPRGGDPTLTPWDVFARVVLYIEERLKVGHVLVHCERGRRRSPTAILAFLVYRGFRALEALNLMGQSYSGEEDWVARYRRTRSLWIDALRDWQNNHLDKCALFRKQNPKLIKAFKGLAWLPQDKAELKENSERTTQKDGSKSQPQSNSSSSPSVSSTHDKKRHRNENEVRTSSNEAIASKSSSSGPKKQPTTSAPPAKRFKLAATSMAPSLWQKKK